MSLKFFLILGLVGCMETPTVQTGSTDSSSALNAQVASQESLHPRGYIILPDISLAPKTDFRSIDGPVNSVSVLPFALAYTSPYIRNDSLILQVSYGGGCVPNHVFLLYVAKSPSSPNTVLAYVYHNALGDICKAGLSKNLAFDITDLKRDFGFSGTVTLQATPDMHGVGDTEQAYIPFELSY